MTDVRKCLLTSYISWTRVCRQVIGFSCVCSNSSFRGSSLVSLIISRFSFNMETPSIEDLKKLKKKLEKSVDEVKYRWDTELHAANCAGIIVISSFSIIGTLRRCSGHFEITGWLQCYGWFAESKDLCPSIPLSHLHADISSLNCSHFIQDSRLAKAVGKLRKHSNPKVVEATQAVVSFSI